MDRAQFLNLIISMMELCSDEMVRIIYHFVLHLAPLRGGEDCE